MIPDLAGVRLRRSNLETRYGTVMSNDRIHVTIALIAALTLAGCASSQTKKGDEAPSEESAEQQEESSESSPSRTEAIPELEELEFRAKAPSGEKVEEAHGVTAYDVGPLTVLHKPTPANEVVSAKVYIDGGSANLTESTAGIERLALQLSTEGGTESTPKDQFTSKLDSMGSSVRSFTGRDYSGYALRCVTKHFDASWELFVEAMLEPAMPEGELEVQRKKQVAQIRKIKQNPNQYVQYLARDLIATSHPYRHRQLGTIENVEAFKRDQLLAYQRSLMNPSRMVLVVVGDIPTKDVVKKVRSSLGRLAAEEWSSPSLPDYNVDGVQLEGRNKEIPTNYIFGKFPAPSPSHEDYPAMRVAMSYLSDQLFEKIRTERSLSYAVSSGIASRRTNSGYLYVSAKKPNETLGVMFDQVEKLKNKKLTEKQVQRTRNVFLTEHFMDLETNSSQATDLARAELVQGDWKKHATFLDAIKSVTPKDVQRVTKKYLSDYQFAVIGSPDSVDKSVIPQ